MKMTWLKSKTTVPIVTGAVVERQRLNKLLQRRDSTRITIIRAPAGYGKTTMLSQWVSRCEEPIAWLSIDKADNDPIRFWQHLTCTVAETMDIEMNSILLPLCNTPPSPPFELLVDSFLNELSSRQEMVRIIIDDYHLIENVVIHEMIVRLVDYLPGTSSIYIASRTELPLPLARWRVKSWLSEIGIKQLRFTYKETKCFYEKKNVVLKDTHSLQHVLKVTEGWAAGIQLAAYALYTLGDNGWSIDQFDGSHPFVEEFLLKEILATLPLSVQEFLIFTSILNRLDPAVCDVLLNRSDSLDVLLELEKLGLFIHRLQINEPVFRCHHLFSETLQTELGKRYAENVISSMYQRAAAVYHEKGDVFSAIELAMNGRSYEVADRWIHASIVDIAASGQTSTFIYWIQTLIENDCSIHPDTLVMYAFMMAMNHKVEEANQIIAGLERRQETDGWMEKTEYAEAAGNFLGVKAYVLTLMNGDIEQAVELIRKRPENRPAHSRWDTIAIHYNRVEPTLLRTSIGVKGKLWPDEKMLLFFDLFRHSIFKEMNMTGFSFGIRAEALYERNRVDEAMRELEKALHYGHRFQDPGLFVPMYLLKSKIYAQKKQLIAALAIVDYAIENVKEHHWLSALHAMKARFYLREGEIFEAENELGQTTMQNGCKMEWGHSFNALTQVRLWLAKGQPEKALKTTIQVKMKAMQEEQISTSVESSVLEAICQAALANEDAALTALHEAMEQGEPYGYVRTFLDEADVVPLVKKYLQMRKNRVNVQWSSVPLSYVERMLGDDVQDMKQGTAMDTLTPREKEVLQLLSSGASNREIATALFLTEGTVRVYLSTIYGKLGVHSRTQAVLLANEH